MRPWHGTHCLGTSASVRSNRIHNGLCCDTLDREFASRVDIGYENDIGLLQCLAKIICQLLGPAVTMRLKSHHQTFGIQGAGSLQCGRHLGGVMAVVIHDAQVRRDVFVFKPPASSGKGGQSPCYQLKVDTQRVCHYNGRQRVEHIVFSGNTQFHSTQMLPFSRNVKGHHGACLMNFTGGIVGTFPAVGNNSFTARA